MQTGARVALAVRQAVKRKAREMAAARSGRLAARSSTSASAKHPLFVTNVDDTRTDDIAAWTYRAGGRSGASPALLLPMRWTAPAIDGLSRDLQGKVDVIVQALAGAKNR